MGKPSVRGLRRGILVALGLVALLPATASAHQLTGRYESPLPLAAYLAAAAIAVALSFGIVLVRSRPAAAAASPGGPADVAAAAGVRVPRVLRLGLRGLGLVAWAWIVVQGIVGGSSDADVGSLILWTYGWVGLPILSAFVAPVWEWLDPFASLHDVGAAVVRRFGLQTWRAAAYPEWLDRWPAVGGFLFFVWLELVYTSARGGRPLAIALVLYTGWTLLMMAQFGRDSWRRRGETFTVWLGILNRLAPLALATEVDGSVARGAPERLRRRPFGAGLAEVAWRRSELVLVAIATASILFDGLSQTQIWFDAFGVPSLAAATLQLAVFLGIITALVLSVSRIVGTNAMAAGLVPIALGYLIAHYFTALVFDGQQIVVALSDPFQLGWNLFGTADFEPEEKWLPYGVVWAVELVAVVGGHVFGAVMGHRVALLGTAGPMRATAGLGAAKTRPVARRAGTRAKEADQPLASIRDVRLRQVPLAILMVFLTTLTLWSLGQGLVQQTAA